MAEDLRKKRTRKAIVEAFVELANERGLVNVTVKAIADRAFINRQTFYNYYQDKYELTQRLNEEMLNLFDRLLRKRFRLLKQGKSSLDFYQSSVSKEMFVHRDEILVLLKIQYDNNGFRQRIQILLKNLFNQIVDKKMTDFESSMLSTMMIESVIHALKNDQPPQHDEISYLQKAMVALLN